MSVIHCGHLVDVNAGKVLGATTVVVDGKRVREVRRRFRIGRARGRH